MEISLAVSATAKPQAVAVDYLLPDDEDDDEGDAPSPRPQARRTASVVVEEC